MKRFVLLVLIAISCLHVIGQDDFTVSSIWSDHMILQSGQDFSINGTGTPKDKISGEIKYLNQTITRVTNVDKDGFWHMKFPALEANLHCELSLSSQYKEINLHDIKTGDVWLIIGGSNTVHLLGNADCYIEEKAKADSNKFKYLVIPKASALTPQQLTKQTLWEQHNTENLGRIPSIAYHLGTSLADNVQNPIGIINCGYGGSLIESWMCPQDLGYTNNELKTINQKAKQKHTIEALNLFKRKVQYEVKVDQLDENRTEFASINCNDSKWETTLVPETFNFKGLTDFDGVVWFRKKVFIPKDVEINKISIGFVDDSDEVFINGQFVGGIEDGYGIRRIYDIPENTMRCGENTIAIRVRDIGGGGGLYGDPSLYYLSGEGISINIAGSWKFRIEAIETDVPMNDIKRPSMLYNQMVHPLTSLPIKGIVWYQGEVEATSLTDFSEYQANMKKLMEGYRREFNAPNLPFIIVQLPSFGNNDSTSYDSWIAFKYAQAQLSKELPHAEIISISDLINTKNNFDIHLSNHDATGTRLAKTVLQTIYHSTAGGLCPTVSKVEQKNNEIILSFDHAVRLIAKDDYNYVKGFEIAQSDLKFTKVQAFVMDQNKIQVKIGNTTPTYIQYGGRINSIESNLYNEEQMPLIPFLKKIE